MVPSVSKEYLLCNNNNRQKFASNHFDQQATNLPIKTCTRQSAFQIKTTKSDARRLSNYFNQSLDQFFQLNSLLFQPSLILYKPFLRLKEFILYTL